MNATKGQFRDHFSGHARDYASYRPTYPDDLYHWLADSVADQSVAWDCATGNGQVAQGLVKYFRQVIASDASSSQIECAKPHPRIHYRVEQAESVSIDEAGVDLITVGQAYHWFDQDRFLQEVSRVLKPGGVLAIWTYKLPNVEDEIDALMLELYDDIVGKFWPPERRFIDTDYRDFEFPWPELTAPHFAMASTWTLGKFLGYLSTWSAVVRYTRQEGHDPLDRISARLENTWGDAGQGRSVSWPLIVKACRKPV